MKLLVGPLRDANIIWVVAAWHHLKTLREGIVAGYKKAGTGVHILSSIRRQVA
jgi:hypothetical protein